MHITVLKGNMEEKPKVQLLALWENQSKNGDTYLSGTLGRNKVLGFKNRYKETDRQPDWILYLQERPEEERQHQNSRPSSGVSDGPRGIKIANSPQPPASNERPPDGMF